MAVEDRLPSTPASPSEVIELAMIQQIKKKIYRDSFKEEIQKYQEKKTRNIFCFFFRYNLEASEVAVRFHKKKRKKRKIKTVRMNKQKTIIFFIFLYNNRVEVFICLSFFFLS